MRQKPNIATETSGTTKNVHWGNECKSIKFKGPIVDGHPWNEAHTKVNSLIYLSLGAEGQLIYYHRFLH